MVLQEDINLLKEKIEQADSIVVGGASGMSAASGFIFIIRKMTFLNHWQAHWQKI